MTRVRVEVAQATVDGASVVSLDLANGATVADALAASALGDEPHVAVAVFGQVVGETRPLADGDRVELLSALLTEPRQARQARARRRPKA